MGKTIQAIALMLHNRPNKHDKKQNELWKKSDQAHHSKNHMMMKDSFSSSSLSSLSSSSLLLPRAGTLIVLPTVAIRQWQSEISRFTKHNSLTVKVYHGNDRNSEDIKEIQNVDIIITSYKILEIEYRKATAGTKVICSVCGKKFYPEKLRIHRKYFCGENAQRTELQSLTQKKKERVDLRVVNSDNDSIEDEDGDGDEISKQKKMIKTLKEQSTKTSKSTITKTTTKDKKNSNKKIVGKKFIADDDNSNDDEEDDDEISKQKKLIKSLKNKIPVVKKVTKHVSKKNVAHDKDDEDEEDEITKQKRLIKSIKDKTTNTKMKSVKGNKTIINIKDEDNDDDDDEDEEEDEDEDEITKQKKLIKSIKGKASVKKIKVPTNNKKIITEAKTPSRKSSRTVVKVVHNYKSKTNNNDDGDDDDDDDEDYEEDSKSSDDDDDSDDDENDDEEEEEEENVQSKKRKVISKSNKKVTPKKAKKDKINDYNDDDDNNDGHDDDDDVDVDMEVERDIKKALLQATKSNQSKSKSILHTVSWFRIILDEAHIIKDRSTSTAKAIFHLTSLYKWCLTGTPLQNRVGELYSLIRFLRIDPDAYYYCKGKGCCPCKSLYYRFTKGKCDECQHSAMQHYCHFNKNILNPIKRSGYIGDGRKAMLKLKQHILDEILLRRTKITRANDIQLPPRIVYVRQEKLDEKEEDFYQALYTQSQAQFNTYLLSGTVLNNYAHIFDILIRLRQAVDHPYLVIYSDARVVGKNESNIFLQSNNQINNISNNNIKDNDNNDADDDNNDRNDVKKENDLCYICHEPIIDTVSANCGHHYCLTCIVEYINTINNIDNAIDMFDDYHNNNSIDHGDDDDDDDGGDGNGDKKKKKSSSSAAALKAIQHSITCPYCKKVTKILKKENVNNHDSITKKNSKDKKSSEDSNKSHDISVWDLSKHRKRSILDKIDLQNFQSSTKMEALMQELYNMEQNEYGSKAIVFSQFVNMLGS